MTQRQPKVPGPREETGLCRQNTGVFCIFSKKLKWNKDACGSDLST